MKGGWIYYAVMIDPPTHSPFTKDVRVHKKRKICHLKYGLGGRNVISFLTVCVSVVNVVNKRV